MRAEGRGPQARVKGEGHLGLCGSPDGIAKGLHLKLAGRNLRCETRQNIGIGRGDSHHRVDEEGAVDGGHEEGRAYQAMCSASCGVQALWT